jgi:hypothetical protein
LKSEKQNFIKINATHKITGLERNNTQNTCHGKILGEDLRIAVCLGKKKIIASN